MAATEARCYIGGMEHHHIAASVAIWAGLFTSLWCSGFTIWIGVWSSRRSEAKRALARSRVRDRARDEAAMRRGPYTKRSLI